MPLPPEQDGGKQGNGNHAEKKQFGDAVSPWAHGIFLRLNGQRNRITYERPNLKQSYIDPEKGPAGSAWLVGQSVAVSGISIFLCYH
jgi:hypothetical protein